MVEEEEGMVMEEREEKEEKAEGRETPIMEEEKEGAKEEEERKVDVSSMKSMKRTRTSIRSTLLNQKKMIVTTQARMMKRSTVISVLPMIAPLLSEGTAILLHVLYALLRSAPLLLLRTN